MAVKVSITGVLSMPRKAAVQLIERTNAHFSAEVTYDVNYCGDERTRNHLLHESG
jgi:hypothetical protein